jgi:hypothetical protein
MRCAELLRVQAYMRALDQIDATATWRHRSSTRCLTTWWALTCDRFDSQGYLLIGGRTDYFERQGAAVVTAWAELTGLVRLLRDAEDTNKFLE